MSKSNSGSKSQPSGTPKNNPGQSTRENLQGQVPKMKTPPPPPPKK